MEAAARLRDEEPDLRVLELDMRGEAAMTSQRHAGRSVHSSRSDLQQQSYWFIEAAFPQVLMLMQAPNGCMTALHVTQASRPPASRACMTAPPTTRRSAHGQRWASVSSMPLPCWHRGTWTSRHVIVTCNEHSIA